MASSIAVDVVEYELPVVQIIPVKGDKPEKGKDYWTAADQELVKAYVREQIADNLGFSVVEGKLCQTYEREEESGV